MLKRLEIAGFKSFARKTVLDFSARATAIVGPNGSGKSTLAYVLAGRDDYEVVEISEKDAKRFEKTQARRVAEVRKRDG